MAPDVFDCMEKELLVIDPVFDDIVMRPGMGVGFGEGPFCPADEFFYISRKSCHFFTSLRYQSFQQSNWGFPVEL